MIDIKEVVTDVRERYIIRNGFVFTSLTYPFNVYDAIVIKNPYDVPCFSPLVDGSRRSLKEHIDFINEYKIEKAVIIADNIDFIIHCKSFKYLKIIPADTVGNNFDYSPLYKMASLKCVYASTTYGYKQALSTHIDYSKINGLEDIGVTYRGHINYENIETLKSLGISGCKKYDLTDVFKSPVLDTLSVIQCGFKSLEGIQQSKKLQCLYLYYNRSLKDISALSKMKGTLKALRIENCPKIEDFSVLGKLENLELLELVGSNKLPNLNFLKSMKNLKTFVFDMNVLDGDLTPCLNLSYVYSDRNRKHYNLKDSDLPKGEYVRGNEDIEEWRRLE